MTRLIVSVTLSTLFFGLLSAAPAATLKVGPHQPFARPSQAIQAAKDGDTIEIDAGVYSGDVATVRANHLTIRGVGNGRAKLPAHGRDAGGKGIWVVTGSDLTVENIEFSGARVRDRNGAGIRPEGKNLTVRNCRFYDCENGILGGNGEMLFEGCEFEHCGPVPNPATHSLYIGERCTKLVFRHNYSTDVIEGHLLKSRAKESWLLYNRLTDENGTGSAVADFPNGGVVVVIGNVMHKGARGNNSRVIAYGMEGIKHERNALYVVNNTMVYEHRHTNAFFVRVENCAEGLRARHSQQPVHRQGAADELAQGRSGRQPTIEDRGRGGSGKPGEVRLPPHGRTRRASARACRPESSASST